MDAAIQVADLSVVFGRHRRRSRVEALRDVSLTVPKGHLLGILGPNGSGKTTLLRCLSGLQSPHSGSVTVLGRHPADPELIPRVGFQPEEPAPWPVLTGREHLLHMAALQGIDGVDARARVAHWLERMGLADAQHRQVKTYSTGMTKRLTLATALLTDPEVLLLDEPTAGLDPEGSELVMKLLAERAAAGGAIVIASHHLQEIENACDSVLVLVQGVVRAQGTLDDLLGTDALNLVVDGLDEAGRARVIEAIEAAGGSVESVRPKRRHLFALFRSWTSGTP